MTNVYDAFWVKHRDRNDAKIPPSLVRPGRRRCLFSCRHYSAYPSFCRGDDARAFWIEWVTMVLPVLLAVLGLGIRRFWNACPFWKFVNYRDPTMNDDYDDGVRLLASPPLVRRARRL